MIARRRWSVAGLAVVALTLGACSNQNSDGEDVTNTLEEAGAPEGQAKCVGDRLEEELDQEQLNDVAGADELSDLSDSLRETVDAVLAECLTGETPSESETTDTTAAEGEGTETTTTTAAG